MFNYSHFKKVNLIKYHLHNSKGGKFRIDIAAAIINREVIEFSDIVTSHWINASIDFEPWTDEQASFTDISVLGSVVY